MTHIEPVSEEVARQQGLGKVMDTYADLGDPEAVFPRILAHADGYAKALTTAMNTAHFEGGVDPRLKELMRLQLATTAGDPYFAGLRSGALDDAEVAAATSGDFESTDAFTDAEKWALRYAYLMYREPENVDAAFYEEGKGHFTEAQIMEMGGLIAVHYGMQVFMATLQA